MRVNFHFIRKHFHKYSLVFVFRRKGAFLFNVNDILDQNNEPKCRKCGKIFKNVSSRNFHEKKSHEATMVFKCGSCKGTRAMKYLKNLRDHVFESHGRQLTAKEKKAVVLRPKKDVNSLVKRMFLNNFESL